MASRPTDESLNSKADLAARKRKPGAAQAAPMGPPVISPPQMPDWRAGVVAAQGGSPTSGPGAGVAAPAPAPSGFSGAVRGMSGPSDNAALAKSIALRKAPAAQRTELNTQDQDASRRLQTVDALLRSPSITPEQQASLRSERMNLVSGRREIGGDIDLINRASVNPTPAQGPSQIVAGRDQINDQLRKELIRQSGPPKGDESDAFAGDDADKVLPKYGGGSGAARGLEDPRVTAIAQAQKQRMLRESQTQADLGGLVDQRADTRATDLAEQVKRRALTSRLGTAEGERALAETEGATAAARFASDPQTMQSELAARQAMAKAAAMKAQAESGAYGGANAVTAGIAGERRQAALSMAGLDTPEAYNQFKAQAAGHLQNLLNLDDGQRAFDNLNQQTIPVLQEIAANDPAEAARIARDLLGQIPETGIAFGDVVKGPLWGGFNVAKKALLSRRVNEARQALMQFAGGAG